MLALDDLNVREKYYSVFDRDKHDWKWNMPFLEGHVVREISEGKKTVVGIKINGQWLRWSTDTNAHQQIPYLAIFDCQQIGMSVLVEVLNVEEFETLTDFLLKYYRQAQPETETLEEAMEPYLKFMEESDPIAAIEFRLVNSGE